MRNEQAIASKPLSYVEKSFVRSNIVSALVLKFLWFLVESRKVWFLKLMVLFKKSGATRFFFIHSPSFEISTMITIHYPISHEIVTIPLYRASKSVVPKRHFLFKNFERPSSIVIVEEQSPNSSVGVYLQRLKKRVEN